MRGNSAESPSLTSIATTAQSLIPRFKRYIHEIAETTSRYLPTEQGQSALETESELLLHTERYLTVDGLRRQLVSALIENRKLQAINLLLEKKSIDCEKIPEYKSEISALINEKSLFKQKCRMLERELEKESNGHVTRYNALRHLFEQLEEKSMENIQVCDKQRIKIEYLESELEAAKDKAKSCEIQMNQNTEEFEKIQNTEAQRTNYLIKEKEELKMELNLVKEKMQEEMEQIQFHHNKQQERAKVDKESLTKKVEELKRRLKQNYESPEENRTFAANREAIDTELKGLREDNKRLGELQQKYRETETTLKAIKQKLSDVQSSSSQSSKYHYEFQSIKQKLIQWIEAASIITKNLSGVEPTPNRLKAYLMNIEKWTEEYRQELRLLRELNSELSRQELSIKDELNRKNLELNEERIRREASENEANLLVGQIKGQSDLLLRLKRAKRIVDEEENQNDENNDEHSRIASVEGINEIVQQFNQEKEKFIQLILASRQQIDQLNEEKDELYKQRETACLQFKRLEEEFNQIKIELNQSQMFLSDQKQTIESQSVRIENLEQSITYQHVETLKHQITDSERRSTIARHWYINELATLRAAVKSLLGWYIRFDRNHTGDKLTITLMSAVAEDTVDDETFINFITDLKPANQPLTAESQSNAIEDYVWNCFKHKDFEFTVAGRYIEKWETWNDQFSARQSFPALLAIIILDEQNRVLSRTASLTSSFIRKQQLDHS